MKDIAYGNMHYHISVASACMRLLREFTNELSEVTVRTGKIKTATWDVDHALDKLAHQVFLHQKQTRRASGK